MAFIGYGERMYTVRERIEGYIRAVREAGLECLVSAAAAGPADAQ